MPTTMNFSEEFAEKFWVRTKLEPNGCLEWQGARLKSKQPYGVVKHKQKMWKAHRVAFLLCVGSIPDGLLVCHRCDNPRCVRPTHLFLGTNQDNQLDALSKGRLSNPNKTHCPRGHEYSEINTYRYRNARFCRTCNANSHQQARSRSARL